MGKLTKNQKLAAEKIEAGKAYSLKEALRGVHWHFPEGYLLLSCGKYTGLLYRESVHPGQG